MKAFQFLLLFFSVWSLVLCVGQARKSDLVARLVDEVEAEAAEPQLQTVRQNKLKHYDYYRLVVTWPFVAYLGDENITNIPERFVINRFMPQRFDGLLTAHYCTDDGDIGAVLSNGDLVEKMKKYWPSLKGDDKGEWKEKWLLDGTCMWRTADLKGKQEYFKTAIDIYETLDLKFALKNINYHPINEGEVYTTNTLLARLKSHFYSQWSKNSKILLKNAQAHLLCVNRRSRQYLHDMHFCFDLQLNSITCPTLEYLQIDEKSSPETSTVPKYCVNRIYFPKSD